MDTNKIVQKCEEVCIDIKKTPWQKFKELLYYNIFPQREINISDIISCPTCGKILTNKNIIDDFDICDIAVEDNKAFYEIFTPCCGKVIYTTDNWKSNLHTEAEMQEEARSRYRQNYLIKEQSYQQAKKQYMTICDLIYEREQGWKKN